MPRQRGSAAMLRALASLRRAPRGNAPRLSSEDQYGLTMPSPGRTRGEIDAERDWASREAGLSQARQARTAADEATRMVNPNYRRAQSAYDQGNADADLFGGRVRRRAGVQRDIQRADLGMQAGAELDAARNTAKAEMTDPFLSAASTRNQRLGQDTEVRKALAGTLGRVVGSDNPAMADPDAMDRMIRQLGPMILEGKMPGAAPAQDTVTADTLSQQFPATQYSVEDILDAVEGSPEELADLETQLLSKGYRRR